MRKKNSSRAVYEPRTSGWKSRALTITPPHWLGEPRAACGKVVRSPCGDCPCPMARPGRAKHVNRPVLRGHSSLPRLVQMLASLGGLQNKSDSRFAKIQRSFQPTAGAMTLRKWPLASGAAQCTVSRAFFRSYAQISKTIPHIPKRATAFAMD